jgi:chromosome segregation ATPase
MNSIITKNSFSNCKNLKKVYIGERVSIENLDLSQTQIKNSNLLKDYQKETDNIIWADASIINQARLQGDNDQTHLSNLIEKLKSLDINIDNKLVKDDQELNQEFDRQIQKKKDLETKLTEISSKANSSQVDKESLQKEVDELKTLVEKLQKEDELNNLKKELVSNETKHQSELKEINLLFDTDSLFYERIDFAGLLEGLKKFINAKKEKLQSTEADLEDLKERIDPT